MAAVEATEWAIDGTGSEARRDDGRPVRCATGAADDAGGTGVMAGGADGAGLSLGVATGTGFVGVLVLIAVNGSDWVVFARPVGAGFAAGVFALAVAVRAALAA